MESVEHWGEVGEARGGGGALVMVVRLGCGMNQGDEGRVCSNHALPRKTDIVQLFVLHPLDAATCHRHVHYVARDDACYSIHGVYGDGSDGAEVMGLNLDTRLVVLSCPWATHPIQP
jgi:hypothetical protein